MSEADYREVERPVGGVKSAAPGGIRRSGEYLEKLEAAGGSCYLLSRHAALEMSRIELSALARFVVTPHVNAHQSFYVLAGHVRSLELGGEFYSGSSFKLESREPVTLEAQSPVSLLYFSTQHDFTTLLDGFQRG